MAILDDSPWAACNFLISIGDAGDGAVHGGFAEISGLNAEATAAEYRRGKARSDEITKVPGVTNLGDVILKRGVVNYPDLYEWLEAVRHGDLAGAKRNVKVMLRTEDAVDDSSAASWTLIDAVRSNGQGLRSTPQPTTSPSRRPCSRSTPSSIAD